MRQYQEDVENLNEVAHNRPRAQLVLGIQQENRHIRTLQQENKELRASLEEHQNALELIMSKYRQHVTRLVSTPYPDMQSVNNQKIQMLAERTEKVCEMAAVMKESVRVDEEACTQQQELMARLMTENKGLRELLEISKKNNSSPRVKVMTNLNKEVQTDSVSSTVVEQEVSVTLPMPAQPRPTSRSPKIEMDRKVGNDQSEKIENNDASPDICIGDLSSGDSDETESEDESVKYDTIKLADRRNKVSVKKEVKEIDPSEVSCPTEETEVGWETKQDVATSDIVEFHSPCITTELTDSKNKMFTPENERPLVTEVVEEEKDCSATSPSNSLTEDQQNLVLVDCLVDQLIKDSVDTSTATADAKAAAEDSIITSDKSNPIPDTDTAAENTSITTVDNGPTSDVQEPITSKTTPSSQKITKNTKVEPSHSRSNSKGKNKKNTEIKGIKNSPRKGNKK